MAISDARHRANEKYNAKAYDEIKVRVAKGRKAELQAFVERHGQSVNGFINSLIDEALERERAGGVPAGAAGSPADSPEGTGTQGAGVMVLSGAAPEENSSSRFTSQSAPDSTTGLDAEPAPKQESLLDIVMRLNAMSPEERERALGCDPESVERYRQEMERKRQRLAELNAKAGGLSRAEDAERRRLTVECRNYRQSGDSAQ